MKWYCERCKIVHNDNELCPKIKEQFKYHPKLFAEAVDFITVAGEEALITTQALDRVAQGVNKLVGTQLSYEGTQQFARDIQVFKRLNEEAFKRCGAFSTLENAKAYFENVLSISKNNPDALRSFEGKLTGYGQEVDWLRLKEGELSSLWEKSTLLNNNAPGVDGVTINRFTGKELSRTTIKASKYTMTNDSKGIKDVKEAIKKGNATAKDIIFGPEGTEKAAREAGLTNPVIEKNAPEQIKQSNARLEKKILNGQATTTPTMQQVADKAKQGAVVGAAVAVTISSITNYVKYRNGELTKDEAFKLIGEDTLKGSLVGAAIGSITIFLPGGVIGFATGMAVGIYIDSVCKNVLDEVFGEGAYGAILNSSGYVYGMTVNLADYYKKIKKNLLEFERNIQRANVINEQINNNFDIFEKMKR